MKKILIQILSSGRSPVWQWENKTLTEAIRNDPRYQALEVSYGLSSLLGAKKVDAIIISVINKKDGHISSNILKDALSNPKHFVFCEAHLFLGEKKQTPSGKQSYEVINPSKLTQERLLEVLHMMLEEFG